MICIEKEWNYLTYITFDTQLFYQEVVIGRQIQIGKMGW